MVKEKASSFRTGLNRPVLTVIFLAIAIGSFIVIPQLFLGDPSDSNGYFTDHITTQTNRAFVAFAIAKGLNGLISVVQSMNFEASAVVFSFGVSPFEILDPVNDLIESISNGLLLALAALVLQKTLLYINGWLVFKALLPASMACFVAALWSRGAAYGRLYTAGKKSLAAALVIGLFIPASIQLSVFIENGILQKTVNNAMLSLERDSKTIDMLGGELAVLQGQTTASSKESEPQTGTGHPEISEKSTPFPALTKPDNPSGEEAESWLGKAVNRIRNVGKTVSLPNIKNRIASISNQLKEKANDMAMSFLKVLIVFTINTVLLPLATLWGLWQLFRWVLNEPFTPHASPTPASATGESA